MNAAGFGSGHADGRDAIGAIHVEREALRAYPPTVTFRDLIRKNKRTSALLIALMLLLAMALGASFGAAAGAAFRPFDDEGDRLFSEQARLRERAKAVDITNVSAPEISALVADGKRLDAEIQRFNAQLIGVDLALAALLGASAAFVLGGVGALWSWHGGSRAILAIAGARPIEKRDDPELINVVEELSIAAGVPMPRVHLINSPALNAFATGRDPAHGAIAITTGLRAQLTRDELAGVIAHEISHIRHYDIRFSLLMATMVGLIVFFSDAMRRGMLRSMRHSGSSSKKGGGAAVLAIALLVALVFSIVAPILATLIHFAFSRQREYLADAGAVELTRYPEGLASALQKLGSSPTPLAQANRATEHLYIVKPLFDEDKDGRADAERSQNLDSVFSTHPPMKKRIERLMALVR